MYVGLCLVTPSRGLPSHFTCLYMTLLLGYSTATHNVSSSTISSSMAPRWDNTSVSVRGNIGPIIGPIIGFYRPIYRPIFDDTILGCAPCPCETDYRFTIFGRKSGFSNVCARAAHVFSPSSVQMCVQTYIRNVVVRFVPKPIIGFQF
jgi:hypothetical protein